MDYKEMMKGYNQENSLFKKPSNQLMMVLYIAAGLRKGKLSKKMIYKYSGYVTKNGHLTEEGRSILELRQKKKEKNT